jgi:hypothetical protein
MVEPSRYAFPKSTLSATYEEEDELKQTQEERRTHHCSRYPQVMPPPATVSSPLTIPSHAPSTLHVFSQVGYGV